MAVTNKQIIETACAEHGITEEVHTFQHWKSMGYAVKKGEKAAFKTSIWKAVQKKDKPDETVMFLKTAAFFKASQVQPIG